MSEDIREQVCEKLRMSPAKASMQLDESTDVTNLSQLQVYVRYISGNRVEEELLMCEPLFATTKSRDVKDKVDAFLASNTCFVIITLDLFALMVHLLCWESAQDSLPL